MTAIHAFFWGFATAAILFLALLAVGTACYAIDDIAFRKEPE